MSDLLKHAEALAEIVIDYHAGQIPRIDGDHVLRWAVQFDEGVRAPIISETAHVLRSTYLSRNKAIEFLAKAASSPKLNGGDPTQFWRDASVFVLHRGGQFYTKRRLTDAIRKSGKSIEIKWWRMFELEDRKAYTDSSDVLRPVSLPDDPLVEAYVANMKYKPHLRNAGGVGQAKLFSSDAARQLLEREFLKAGVKIRAGSPNLGDSQRPLGHMSLETLGFGSTFVTFRNCPNNAPLALWAGDPWTPLFPRITNREARVARLFRRGSPPWE